MGLNSHRRLKISSSSWTGRPSPKTTVEDEDEEEPGEDRGEDLGLKTEPQLDPRRRSRRRSRRRARRRHDRRGAPPRLRPGTPPSISRTMPPPAPPPSPAISSRARRRGGGSLTPLAPLEKEKEIPQIFFVGASRVDPRTGGWSLVGVRALRRRRCRSPGRVPTPRSAPLGGRVRRRRRGGAFATGARRRRERLGDPTPA